MSIIEEIKKASIEARKARSEFALSMTTLLSEVTMFGKNKGRETTDLEAIAVVKKFVDNLAFTINSLEERAVEGSEKLIEAAKAEKKLFEQFLPKQMSIDELKAEMEKIITELSIAGQKGMGLLMSTLKARFEGTYDGKSAANISKELLSK